jgi:hypothetical protein
MTKIQDIIKEQVQNKSINFKEIVNNPKNINHNGVDICNELKKLNVSKKITADCRKWQSKEANKSQETRNKLYR